MKILKIKEILLVALGLLVAVSCRSTEVKMVDPGDNIQMTEDYNFSDLLQIADRMVDDLGKSPAVRFITKNGTVRPVVLMGTVENRTRQHIDMQNITDSIRTKMLQLGHFSFVDRSYDKRLISEMQLTNSDYYNPKTVKKIGNLTGAEYMLLGRFTEMRQEANDTEIASYKFTLNLLNIENGQFEWSAEKIIRKKVEKTFFSF